MKINENQLKPMKIYENQKKLLTTAMVHHRSQIDRELPGNFRETSGKLPGNVLGTFLEITNQCKSMRINENV